MMCRHNVFLAGGAVAMLLACSAGASTTWQYQSGGDSAVAALTLDGEYHRGVFEGRYGNQLDLTKWEAALWEQRRTTDDAAQATVAKVDYPWVNGQRVPFSVTWDGVKTLVAKLGGKTLTYDEVAGAFSDVFLRTKAAGQTWVRLDNLVLETQAGGGRPAERVDPGPLGSLQNNGVYYTRIRSNDKRFNPFTLKGDVTFIWNENPDTMRPWQLDFQVILTNTTQTPDIPAPAGAGVVMVALGLGAMRRRRS